MLHSLQHASAWNTSAYVCRGCRHKLLAAQTRRARFHSTYAPYQENGDDWFSNFNTLSEGSPASKPQDTSDEKGNKRLSDGKKRSDDGREAGSGGKGEKKAQTRRRRSQRQDTELESLKASLSHRLSNGTTPEGRSEPGHMLMTTDTLAVPNANNVRDNRRTQRQSPANLRRREKRRTVALSAAEDSGHGTRPAKKPSIAKADDPPKNKQLEDIVRELQEEFRVKLPVLIQEAVERDKSTKIKQKARPQSSEDLTSTTESQVSKTSWVDSTDLQQYSEATKDKDSEDGKLEGIYERLQKSVPYGASSAGAPDKDTIQPIPEKPPPIGKPSFVSISSPVPSYSRAVPAPRSNERRTLTRTLEESRNRPKWGGITTSSGSEKDADPGFLSSLEPSYNRRTSSKRLAMSVHLAAKSPFADSPAELAEMQAPSSVANDSQPANDTPSNLEASHTIPANNMDLLRKGLQSELERKNGNERSELTPNKPSIIKAPDTKKSNSDVHSDEQTTSPGGLIRKFNTGSELAVRYVKRLLGTGEHISDSTRIDAVESKGKNEAPSSSVSPQQDTQVTFEAEQKESDLASQALAKLHNSLAGENKLAATSENRDAIKLTKPSEKIQEIVKKPESTKVERPKTRRMRRQIGKEKDVIQKIESVGAGAAQAKPVKKAMAAGGNGSEHGTPKMADTASTSGTKISKPDTKQPADQQSVVQPKSSPGAMTASQDPSITSTDPADLTVTALNISQPPVPGLEYGLDRVLFNPGVYQLQDKHSRVYNFDPYLQRIMPVVEFDYNALKEYKTSSQDPALSILAKEHGKRYIGSTSSMTGTLGHFHYLLSSFRPLNLTMLSRGFPDKKDTVTNINKSPNAIFLRHKGDEIYAVDADKEYDGANVLMMLGKSMEKLLTLPTAEYERYRKTNSHSVSEEERTAPESYEYTTMGDFLMRSQLDAHDSRLPGTGMFDLKTRAVVSVRMRADDFVPMTGYEIHTLQGRFESYEREYYDMIRATMLKYMLQVRMGRMDGIFVAYHNVERIFGFQYIPLHEMDRAIHGQAHRCLGDQEFKLSLQMLNKVFDKATAKFPGQSLRFHFEATEEAIDTGSETAVMWIYAEPMAEADIDVIQSKSKEKVAEFERTMMGIEKDTEDASHLPGDEIAAEGESTDTETKESANRSELDLAISSHTTSASSRQLNSTTTIDSKGYSTTQTNADPGFAKSAEASGSRELMPLFVASIICQSRVDGSVVHRPEKLKAEDSWEVQYLLQEWDTNEAAWARYADTKTRRKQAMEHFREEEEDEGATENGEGEKKKIKTYIDFLQSVSQRGRDFRGKMDQLDAGKEPVVVGQPLHVSNEMPEDEVQTVGQYMDWMYQKLP